MYHEQRTLLPTAIDLGDGKRWQEVDLGDGTRWLEDMDNGVYKQMPEYLISELSIAQSQAYQSEIDEVNLETENKIPMRQRPLARLAIKAARGAVGLSLLYGPSYVGVDAGMKLVTNRADQISFENLRDNLLGDVNDKAKFITERFTGEK